MTEKLHPAATQPTCTAFLFEFFTTMVDAINLPVAFTAPPLAQLQNLAPGIPYNTGNGENINIVCAVFPQTRIRSLVLAEG